MFITLVVLCIAACVALALVGVIGSGGGPSGEQLTSERMARREAREAAPSNVTPLPGAGSAAANRDDDAAA